MVIMSRGKELSTFSSGNAYHISVPPEVWNMLRDPSKALEVHHNHPIDRVSFSPSDLMVFREGRGMAEFFAHTESVSFKISRTDKTSQINEKLIKSLTLEYDKKAAVQFMKGRVSIAEVENNRPHYIAKRLHERKIVKYEVMTGEAAGEVDTILNKILGD